MPPGRARMPSRSSGRRTTRSTRRRSSGTSRRRPRRARPLPFYLYEFRARCGYSIPLGAIERLRELAPNLAGLKVSNQPFAEVEPFLIEGLDVFVGAESLVLQGLERGAAGAVSGLAAAFPELVAGLVRDRSGRRRRGARGARALPVPGGAEDLPRPPGRRDP